MGDAITNQNLGLHLQKSALDFYDGKFALRSDEAHLITEFFPKPPSRILDLGVGNGRTTVPLHEMGYQVTGIEYCEDLVKAGLRDHPEVNLLQGDARKLNYPDAHFDVVWFSWNGIDYMCPYAEREAVLREARRVLKPGGLFFVSSHNALGVIGRLLKPIGLTLQALKFLRNQFTLRRPVASWYFVWKDSALGAPLFYSAPPGWQARALEDHGFVVSSVRSVAHPDRAPVWWKDVHINYLCHKPPEKAAETNVGERRA